MAERSIDGSWRVSLRCAWPVSPCPGRSVKIRIRNFCVHEHGARRNNRVVTVVGTMYDDAKLRFYESSRGLTSLAVGDRAICPRPLLSATQSVPRACIVYLKLASASASASAYRRSRGVEHAFFDLTGHRRLGENRRSLASSRPTSFDCRRNGLVILFRALK